MDRAQTQLSTLIEKNAQHYGSIPSVLRQDQMKITQDNFLKSRKYIGFRNLQTDLQTKQLAVLQRASSKF